MKFKKTEMVAYNFKKRFAPLIISGAKPHTIRGHRKRHARPGEAMQLYTGMRTKHCIKLLDPDPICVSVKPIVISESSIQLDGLLLLGNQVDRLAEADGFETIDEFFKFFRDTHGLPFEGVLIEWTLRRS